MSKMQRRSFGTYLKDSATRRACKAHGVHGCNMYSLALVWVNTSQLHCFPVSNLHCQQQSNRKNDLPFLWGGGSSRLLHFCLADVCFLFSDSYQIWCKYAEYYRDTFLVQKWPMGVTVFPPLQVKFLVKNIFSLVKSTSAVFCFLTTMQFHTLFLPNLFYWRLIYGVIMVGARHFFLAFFFACFSAFLPASFIHQILSALCVRIIEP